ncbi:hypothetical protein DPMN_027003 [Dreissena polymorpha]|uniref:Uncharacterized protein n=1 Tax=Dreissena polymorpha TaxID=45954 RepID=A0A9D4LSP4_DREPO|nr:hypothetical protein DPMN_027003 [Dreissena polymorpha]
MDLKLNDMDSPLKAHEGLEKKADSFEKKFKQLCVHMDDLANDTSKQLKKWTIKIERTWETDGRLKTGAYHIERVYECSIKNNIRHY